MKIELDAPNIGASEKKYINEAVDSGFVSTFGPYVPAFEDRFADYLGANRAVSMQSGTAALHIALYEMGIKAQDEVIVPVLTFIASINPAVYLGAEPVFVDVDIDTWNIDPQEIIKKITGRTKAIIPVHLYGNPCNMDAVMEISRKYNLYVVEDATQSLGVKYKGRSTGTFGDLGCFSFNGNKTMTTGGGGMVVGDNRNRLEHIKFLVNQARDESKGYYHPEVGFNYRMTNIEAALGLAQMDRLDEFLARKQRFNRIYREELGKIDSIQFQREYNGAEVFYWLTCVLFEEDIDVSGLQKKLKEKGIPTRRIFMPIVEFPPYRAYRKEEYKNAYHIYERGLCLPSSTLNKEEDIYFVCKAIKELIKR